MKMKTLKALTSDQVDKPTKEVFAAFPSQPQEPYMPITVILMAAIIIIKGAGNWSMDSSLNT